MEQKGGKKKNYSRSSCGKKLTPTSKKPCTDDNSLETINKSNSSQAKRPRGRPRKTNVNNSAATKSNNASSTVVKPATTTNYTISDSDSDIEMVAPNNKFTVEKSLGLTGKNPNTYLKKILDIYSCEAHNITESTVTKESTAPKESAVVTKNFTITKNSELMPSTSSGNFTNNCTIPNTFKPSSLPKEEEIMDFVNTVLSENDCSTMSETELDGLIQDIENNSRRVNNFESYNTSDSIIDLSKIIPKKKADSIDLTTSNIIDPKKATTEKDSPKQSLECPICMESLIGGNVLAMLCGHVFCRTCIDNISKRTKQCPICRKVFQKNQAIPIYL